MEEIQARLNRLEAELSAVRAEASAMREQTAGVRRQNDAIRRQNAMLRLAMIAAFAAYFLIGPAASPKPREERGGPQVAALQKSGVADVLRAKKLEIVDDKGNTRISLEIEPALGPKLGMLDEKGEQRAALRSLPDGTSLVLMDGRGNGRAVLLVKANGRPGLVLFGGQHDMRTTVSAHAELGVFSDAPYLELMDKEGKLIWQAPPK